MKKTRLASLLVFSFALAASCVTVNVPVHFPDSAVQRATDDYVRELYRAKTKGKTPVSDPSPTPAAKKPTQATHFSIFASAWAGEGEFTVDSAKAGEIAERLRGRVDEVITQKRAGSVGETNDGLLSLRGGDKLKPLLKKKVEKLVADENSDREELYEEVALSNRMPKNGSKKVRESFTRSFQAESPSGSWVQGADGKWSQKP